MFGERDAECLHGWLVERPGVERNAEPGTSPDDLLLEYVFLAGKVAIEGPHGDLRLGRDVFHGDLVESALFEESEGDGLQLRDHHFGALRPQPLGQRLTRLRPFLAGVGPHFLMLEADAALLSSTASTGRRNPPLTAFAEAWLQRVTNSAWFL